MRRAWVIIPVIVVASLAVAVGYRSLSRDPMAEIRLMMAHGDLRGAQLKLRAVVRDHPEQAEAHLRLGEVQLKLGDPIAAEHQLREATDRGADEHATRPLLALASVEQGRGDAVLRDGDLTGLDPNEAAQMHVARALAAVATDRSALARSEAAAARAAAPRSTDAALNAARIGLATGDLTSAKHDIDDALALGPNLADALMLRADLLARSGDPAGAIKAYGAALGALPARDAAAAPARLARARLEMDRDDGAARRDVDAVLHVIPRSPLGNMLASMLDARAGHWRAADEALAQVGPTIDRFPRADLLVATVKANNGQLAQALDAADQFNRRNPGDRSGVVMLGSLELAANHQADAVRLLEPWNSAQATPEILALLSQAYALSGDRPRAEALLRRAGNAAGRPADASGLDRLAAIALRENDPALAADELSEALDRGPRTQLVDVPAGEPGRPASGGRMAADAQNRTAAGLVVALLRAGEVERAAYALDRLRASHADLTTVDLLTGDVKLAQFDVAGARAAFERAHARTPDQRDAIVELARVMRLQGDAEGATTLVGDALTKRPTDPALLGTFVDLSLSRGTPKARDDAIGAAETAHKAAPNDVGIANGLATLDLRTNRPADALAVADAMPGETPIKLGLRADSEHALGHWSEAVAAWQALLAQVPTNVPLRHRIVGFLLAGGRLNDAGTIIEDGLGKTPDDPTLQSDAVRLAVARNGLAAGIARADGLAAKSADPRARLLTGELLLSARKFEPAADAFARARAGLPSGVPADLRQTLLRDEAIARIQGGDRAGGVKLLDAGLASDPGATVLQETLAELEISSGDLSAARPRLMSVLKAQPNNVVALNDVAVIEQQQGDLVDARRDAARAYRQAQTPQTADTLGWTLLAGGDVTNALVLLRQAAGQTSDPSIQYHLAAALKRDGKPAEAKAVLGPVVAGKGAFSERPDAEKLMRSMTTP